MNVTLKKHSRKTISLLMALSMVASLFISMNSMVVQASTPLLLEGFENGLKTTTWPIMSGKTTATVSTDKAHTSTSSLKISSYYATAHTYTVATQGTYTVTAYVYDDASVVSPYFFIDVEGMNKNNIAYKTYLGLYSNSGNKAYWKYRMASSWVDTTIARTTGWHKLKFMYTSNKDIKLSIDDQEVYTSEGTANAGIYNTFTTMNIGNQLAQGAGATNGTFTYVDDISIEDTDSVSETLLNPPSVADFSVTQNGLTMTANYTPFVGDASTFQWSVLNTTNGNFEDIAGATSKAFTINQSYMNKTFKLIMTPKTVFGVKIADIVGNITESFFQNAPVPSVDGVVITQDNMVLNGSYIFATTPSSGSSDMSTYRWLVSDTEKGTYSEISGANGKTLTLTKDYQNKWFKFEVTPKTEYLSSNSKLSDAIQESYYKQILPTVVSITTPSIIKVGQISTADVNCVKGLLGEEVDPSWYVYTWYASDTSDGTFNLVETKTGNNTFTPTAEYAGAYFKFSVQPSDINGLLGVTVSSTNVVRESSSAVEAVNSVGGNTSTLAKVIKRYISELGLASQYNALSTQQMELVNQAIVSKQYTALSDLVSYITEAIEVNNFKYVLKDFQSGYTGFMDDMGYWANQPLATDNTPGFIAGNKVMKLAAKKTTITFMGGGEGGLKDAIAAIKLIPKAVIKFRYFIPTDQTIISNKFAISGTTIAVPLTIEKGVWKTVTCDPIDDVAKVTNLTFTMEALLDAFMYIDDLTVETDIKPSIDPLTLNIGNVNNLYVCNFDDSTDVNFKGSMTEAVTTIADKVTTVTTTTPLTLPTSLTNVGLDIVDDTTAVGNKLLKFSWNNAVDTSSLRTTSQYDFYTTSVNRMSNINLRMRVYLPSGIQAKALAVYLERPDGTIAKSYPMALDTNYTSGWYTLTTPTIDNSIVISKLGIKLVDVKGASYICVDDISIISDENINMIANYVFVNDTLDSTTTNFSKYQWYQSSSIDGKYTAIDGATSVNLKVSRTTTKFYKCEVTPTANYNRKSYKIMTPNAYSVSDLMLRVPVVNSVGISHEVTVTAQMASVLAKISNLTQEELVNGTKQISINLNGTEYNFTYDAVSGTLKLYFVSTTVITEAEINECVVSVVGTTPTTVKIKDVGGSSIKSFEVNVQSTSAVEYKPAEGLHSNADPTKSIYVWYVSDSKDGDYKVLYVSTLGDSRYTPNYESYGAYIKVGVIPTDANGLYGELLSSSLATREKTKAYMAMNSLRAVEKAGTIETVLPRYIDELGLTDEFDALPSEKRGLVYNAVGGREAAFESDEDLATLIGDTISDYLNADENSILDKPNQSSSSSSSSSSIYMSAPVIPIIEDSLFTDTESVAWAKKAIAGVAKKGIMIGKQDKVFAPNDDVTRAEFVTILVRAFKLSDSTATSSFADVENDKWYYGSIATAEKLGLTQGVGDGTFGVNKKISRQEMVTLLSRFASYTGITLNTTTEYADFADQDSISDYAKQAVEAMVKSGVVKGSDNKFMPYDNATRAMAAQVIYNLLQVSGGVE